MVTEEKRSLLKVGDRISCKDNRDMRRWALNLSAEGYGVALLGYHDIYQNILTVTALPIEKKEDEKK